jgi:hypothetical protein
MSLSGETRDAPFTEMGNPWRVALRQATPALSDFWHWPKVQVEAVLFDYLLFDYGQPRKMSTGKPVC